MGVYIEGIEMPTDHPMWIVVHSDGTVEANEVSASRPVGWQTLRNAAVAVPPHGRLIDADALIEHLEFTMKHCTIKGHTAQRYREMIVELSIAPTIILAKEVES